MGQNKVVLHYEYKANKGYLYMLLKDFLTISEFAEWTGIPRSALIYYDKVGLFKPAHRAENNYRYYTYLQTITVNLINTLKSIGVPLETIGALMRNRTPEELLELLSNKERDIIREIEHLLQAKKVISVFNDHIRKGLTADISCISVNYLGNESYTLGPLNDYTGDETFYNAFQRYCQDLEDKGGNLHYPMGGWWSCMSDFMKNPVRPTRFFSVDPDGKTQKKAGRYLVGYNRGFYGEIDDLPERMLKHASDNNLEFIGPMYNIFILDEISVLDPNNYLLQATVLLK